VSCELRVKEKSKIKEPKSRFMVVKLVCKYTTVDKISIIDQTGMYIINIFGAH